jgi:hypothetical protein
MSRPHKLIGRKEFLRTHRCVKKIRFLPSGKAVIGKRWIKK